MSTDTSKILGINGLGRIGKLTLWHHAGRKFFNEIVINVGREVGTGMDDLIHYIERDSTYGRLDAFIHGFRGESVITDVDSGTFMVNGVKVKILSTDRNPKDIAWAQNNVGLVVDTTGQFLDPNLDSDAPTGCIRGHLTAGARKVIASAPFKLKQGTKVPDDAVTTVMGINDKDYDPVRHSLIPNASCTTTCLAHMIKPLLDAFGLNRVLFAPIATIHAATASQEVLDRLPKTGKTDLRKNRSIMNNIILTTTGAAKALQQVIPEMANIGFIAESVRIPTATGFLTVLVINLQEELDKPPVKRDVINQIYQKAAQKQNVSSDIIGSPRAAVVIEGHETHTRTACISIDLEHMQGIDKEINDCVCAIQVTQEVIYGWYDNEMASYVNMLGDRTVTITEPVSSTSNTSSFQTHKEVAI